MGVHVIGIHGVDNGGAVGNLFGQFGVVRVGSQLFLQGFHLLHRVQRRSEHQFHRGVDIQRWIEPGVLFQISGRHAGAKGGVARVGQTLAAQNTQKRRFAGAVCTNNADAVAALDARVHIPQYLVFAEALAQVLQFQQHIRYILNSKMMPPPFAGSGNVPAKKTYKAEKRCARPGFPAPPAPSQCDTVPHRNRP